MSISYEPCRCSAAGWCERYQRNVNADLHDLCQSRPDLRKKWDDEIEHQKQEQIRQEMVNEQKKQKLDQVISELESQGIQPHSVRNSEGLGNTLEKAFSKFGITEDLIKEWTGLKECGCTKRKQWLNRVFPYRKQ